MSALFALLAVVLVPWALGGTLLGMAGFDDERDRLGRFAWDLAAGSLALALLLLGLGWAGPGLGARP